MGIRETLNKNQPLAIGVSLVFIAGAVALVAWNASSKIPSRLKQVYYSDDDGKTYFVDDVNKLYPFDHDGKPAYKAYVYKGGDGQTFVGYLERLTDSAKATISQLRQNPGGDTESQVMAQYVSGAEVKLPGDTKWIPESSPRAVTIMQPKSPSGDTDVHGVYP